MAYLLNGCGSFVVLAIGIEMIKQSLHVCNCGRSVSWPSIQQCRKLYLGGFESFLGKNILHGCGPAPIQCFLALYGVCIVSIEK